ncbi:uncharacterized protein LOC135342701 isoform X2 [Halichondria panicea]|uniref:uncharacterized protein LOC135342701 isoform X2 n=1 Tax=Halichondria panicea TaxID=6063 RepID=UPI00312B38CE
MKGQSLERFSFNWSKVGIDDTQPPADDCKPNILTFKSVREEDLGYYQCEVKEMKAGKMVVVLTVYRALYEDTLMSESLLGEYSGAAGQKRRLSAGETSSAKHTRSISPQGECAGVAGQKRKLSAGETSSAKRTQSISSQGECSGVAGQKRMLPVQTTQGPKMTTGTPEYKAICSCRVVLTDKLSACIQDVAKHLRQSGALTDRQCQTIIHHEDGAEKLMDMIIVDVKEPDTTLDAFSDLVTAIKNSGNKHFLTFVKDVIEEKRKEFYRELLTVPPSFVASQEYDVFISYSREVGTMRTVDTLLRPPLEQEGLTVFVDRDRVRPGDRWRSEIASAIKTCKAFICVLTKRYMRSVYCNGELYEAEALRKRMFPVVCEDGWRDVPGGAPVMEVVQEVQYVSLVAEDSETQLKKLVQSIKTSVSA